MCKITRTQSWLFSMWGTVSSWLSVFSESFCVVTCGHTEAGTRCKCHNQGWILRSLCTPHSPLIQSSAVARWQPELSSKPTLTLITAQIFGKSNSHRDTGVVRCRIKQAWTRQTENEIMRQMRTDETEDKRGTEPTNEERNKALNPVNPPLLRNTI